MEGKSERKKSKRKHKKHAKFSHDEQESAAVESQDTNASLNEKVASSDHSPLVQKESRASLVKKAPKPNSSNVEWSLEQEQQLLHNVKKYTVKLSGKQAHSQRVDWSKVEQVENFTQFEMQGQYKKLTKKVRKTRSVQEIVDDALIVHKEVKSKPLPKINKKVAKQPPNAFSTFCKAKRASLVEKHPELNFGDIHRKLCEAWKELSDEKREKYINKAEKAKVEFYEELRKIHEELISQIKKPMSAYDLWKAERIEDGDLEGDETEDDFLLQWENLPKSSKKGWLQAATAESERYDREVRNITGQNGRVRKKTENVTKEQKRKTKEETASDDHQQSSSSFDNSKGKMAVSARKGQNEKKKTEQKQQKPKAKEQRMSDDSLSAPEDSGLKRKLNSSEQAGKSPLKKTAKKKSSSESSSDEEAVVKPPPVKKEVKKEESNSSDSSDSSSDED